MTKLKIIDNFLNQDDFNYLSNLKLTKIEKDQIKVYHNSIDKKNNLNLECISEEKIKQLQKNYHEKTLEILRELNPKKVNLYDYSEFHIIETGANYTFPIHDDIPDKLLSGVIYLKPQNNSGTIFYDTKSGQGKREVKWKQNKAVFFSRKEKETWHSYEGDKRNNRVVLVYNLMTRNLKSVYKVENKSFFLGKIRQKLNPYLHRYFGKII